MELKKSKYSEIPIPGGSGAKGENMEFVQMLMAHDISKELAMEVASQVADVQNEEMHNIVFILTEGKYVITVIHVPRESINDGDGPVLMAGSTENHILAAFSREAIHERLTRVDRIEEKAGLPGVAEQAWVAELEKMAEAVKLELQNNPPSNWAEELGK